MSRLRVCLVASATFPVKDPYAGGLEAATATLAQGLTERGHDVSLFAAAGSHVAGVRILPVAQFRSSPAAQRDVHARPDRWMAEHHAYLGLMLDLAETGSRRFDVVHDHSTHHLPVAMARLTSVPVVTTLHTPPLAWVESAAALGGGASTFTAVSEHTRTAWQHAVDAVVVRNGVDTQRWSPGTGGGPAVWTGRIVPEKAPHLAIDACRAAGVPLVLAGPVHDPAYFATEVAPRLGPDARHVGHLAQHELSTLVGSARVAVVTPDWDEPYGLVAAEALASGTPVAGFARGGISEIVVPGTGALAPAGDVQALGRAVTRAALADRRIVREHAMRHLSLDRMVAEYEQVYELARGARCAA